MQYVILIGKPLTAHHSFDRLHALLTSVVGPFNTYEEATQWANANKANVDVLIVPMEEPRP